MPRPYYALLNILGRQIFSYLDSSFLGFRVALNNLYSAPDGLGVFIYIQNASVTRWRWIDNLPISVRVEVRGLNEYDDMVEAEQYSYLVSFPRENTEVAPGDVDFLSIFTKETLHPDVTSYIVMVSRDSYLTAPLDLWPNDCIVVGSAVQLNRL